MATDNIARKVEAIRADTSRAVTAITGVGQTIIQIKDLQESIATSIHSQITVTADIAKSVNQAAEGGASMTAAMGVVARAAKRTSESASNTERAASALGSLSKDLAELLARRSGATPG